MSAHNTSLPVAATSGRGFVDEHGQHRSADRAPVTAWSSLKREFLLALALGAIFTAGYGAFAFIVFSRAGL